MATKPRPMGDAVARKKLLDLSALIAELLETHKPVWTGTCAVCHNLPAWCPATRIVLLLYPQLVPEGIEETR